MPTEHGGWGLLFEPLIIGLIVAPSWAGLPLALALVSLFLLRHPLKIALSDRWRGVHYPRTDFAQWIAGFYGILAMFGGAIGLALAEHTFWQPLAMVILLALVQLSYDVRLRSRELIPEVAGTLAAAAVAPVLASAAGWQIGAWLALWILVAFRGLAATLYVRARLRLERGATSGGSWVIGIHVLAVVAVAGMASFKWVPWLALVGLLLMLVRAVTGLSGIRHPSRPRDIGIREFAYGAAFVALVSAGYRLPL